MITEPTLRHLLCAVILLATGTAQAASLTVCENDHTHKVRLAAIGASCRSDETTIMLTGSAGPTGPTGPSGPTGPQGPAGGPSVDLEANGTLVGSTCDVGGCHGTLSAAAISLSLELLLNPTPISGLPNGSPPCYNLAGNGTLDARAVSFEGRLCVRGFQYVVSGSLSSDISAAICQPAPQTVVAAQLTAFGAVSTSGPPLPNSNPIPSGEGTGIVNLIGSSGQVATPCPSP